MSKCFQTANQIKLSATTHKNFKNAKIEIVQKKMKNEFLLRVI